MPKDLPLSGEKVIDHSDQTLVRLLEKLKTTTDPEMIRQISEDIERVIFHKQFENA